MKKLGKLKIFILTASSLLVLSGNAFAASLDEGIELYKIGQYEKAVTVLEKVAQAEPDNADVHLWLSKCYEASFDIDKSLKETKVYQLLKYKHSSKPSSALVTAQTNNQDSQEKPKEEKVIDANDPLRLVYLNDVYLNQLLNKRNPADEIKNLKFLDFKSIKKVLASVPTDSDSLIKMNREYEIKSHYGLANSEDLIILNKTRASLIAFDIDTKKFDLDKKTNEERKKSLEYDIKKLVKSHNDCVEVAAVLINQPVLQVNEPLSFEYFKALDTEPNDYIKKLEEKKSVFRINIERATTDIKNYTKSIIPLEKELRAKKEKIEPRLLEVSISTLDGSNKEQVAAFTSLEDKVKDDKKKLLNFVAEQGILIESFNKINDTIKKIKPDYLFKDAPLPKQEKLQELN